MKKGGINLKLCVSTIAEHFVIGSLAGFGVEDAEFEVD